MSIFTVGRFGDSIPSDIGKFTEHLPISATINRYSISIGIYVWVALVQPKEKKTNNVVKGETARQVSGGEIEIATQTPRSQETHFPHSLLCDWT